MRVEPLEVEFASDEEYHRAHGVDVGVTPRLAFSRLEQTIECFEEAIGLPSLSPRHDAVEVATNHFRDLLHRPDFGAHDIGAPLCQQGRDDIDLFALKNFSKLLAVQPGAGRSLGRDMGDQRVQVGALTRIQVAPILEQGPAQPFQVRGGLLLDPAHLVHGSGGMRDDMKLVERDAGIGKAIGDTLDEGGRHIDAGRVDLAGIATVSGQVLSERFDGLCVLTIGDEDDLPLDRIGNQGQIVVSALARGFINGDSANIGQVRSIHGQFDILGANGIHPIPRFAHDSCDGSERHLPGQHKHQRFEQQREAVKFTGPIRLDLRDFTVRQLDARHTNIKMAFMLKEVQMSVTLDLRIVDRMNAFDAGISKTTPGNKVDVDGQALLFGIEIDTLDVPGIGNTQRGFKDLILH